MYATGRLEEVQRHLEDVVFKQREDIRRLKRPTAVVCLQAWWRGVCGGPPFPLPPFPLGGVGCAGDESMSGKVPEENKILESRKFYLFREIPKYEKALRARIMMRWGIRAMHTGRCWFLSLHTKYR